MSHKTTPPSKLHVADDDLDLNTNNTTSSSSNKVMSTPPYVPMLTGSPTSRSPMQGPRSPIHGPLRVVRRANVNSTAAPKSRSSRSHSPSSSSSSSVSTPSTSWKAYFHTRTHIHGTQTNMRQQGEHKDEKLPVVVLLHGAGHTSLSWGAVAAILGRHNPVLAFDFRFHGGTKPKPTNTNTTTRQGDHKETDSSSTTNSSINGNTNDDEEGDLDMSIDTLIGDTVDVLQTFFGGADKVPELILLGHSLGGAIATKTAATNKLPVVALSVVDVVEGSAIQSLSKLREFLQQVPDQFFTVREAIKWSLSTNSSEGMNRDLAQTAVPARLRYDKHREVYEWKINLLRTQTHWHGWFDNLSRVFLSVPIPKLLILAGTDRLDKTLIIAQMQGKYQLALFPNCGHFIQEDSPERLCDAFLKFAARIKNIPVTLK